MLWLGLGAMTYPIYFPLLAMSYDLSGGLIGLILALPACTIMITIPFIKHLAKVFGIEAIICTAGVLLGCVFMTMGFASTVDK